MNINCPFTKGELYPKHGIKNCNSDIQHLLPKIIMN